MLTNKEAVIQTIERYGEMGVTRLSEKLNLDKGTARKVALEAASPRRSKPTGVEKYYGKSLTPVSLYYQAGSILTLLFCLNPRSILSS
jgi:hypothetical protein